MLSHTNILDQFIQSYKLTDEDIEELIAPTVNEIKDVIAGDYRKALLFMGGMYMKPENVMYQSDVVRAMMFEPKMFDDPFIRQRIKRAINKRIEEAKIGVLDIRANYSILCGDPFALCQSVFGLPVTGLLKAGEIYNKYWIDAGASEVACFRAPMSTHSNILKRRIANNDDVNYWYQYITTCTLFNAWDDGCAALNGAD